MKIRTYLGEHLVGIIIYVCVAIFMGILLSMQNFTTYGIIFIETGFLLAFAIFMILDYVKRASFYKNVLVSLKNINKKYLLSEIIDKPIFYEGSIFYDVLSSCNKSMNDEIAKYKISSKEYKEYIEMWIHEVKTPVASIKLLMENSNSELSDSTLEELQKIDNYLEQVLYYARSNSLQEDYIIKKTPIEVIVKRCLKNNAKEYIRSRVSILLEELNGIVFTDEKWMTFIIAQIINNAIKYKDTEKRSFVKIYSEEHDNSVILYIEDNGIGIKNKDLNRVFDKGFTGDTGRRYAKSTGIGLYLAKKLCVKMGQNINIVSVEGKKTIVSITFPKGEYSNVTQ